MSPTLSLTEDQIFDALGGFLDAVLPAGVLSLKGQTNRVPEPNVDDFVIMTSQGSTMLSTNEESWDTLGIALSEVQATELRIQLDVHGSNSSDNAQVIKTLFRSQYGANYFLGLGLSLAPLYVSDGSRIPFVNGEDQWEDRWVLIVSLEVKPTISYVQDYFTSLDLRLAEVDTVFPPSADPPASLPGYHTATYIVPPEEEDALTLFRVPTIVLSGQRVVKSVGDTDAAYPDIFNTSDAQLVLGVTIAASMANARSAIETEGELVEPSWTWTPGPVFCGADGQLTQSPRLDAAWLRQIGVALAPDRILVQLGPVTLL